MKKYAKAYIAKNGLFSVILRKKEGVKTSLYFEIRDKQTQKRYYEFLNKYLSGTRADIDIEADAKKQADIRLSQLTAMGFYSGKHGQGVENLTPVNFNAFFENYIGGIEREKSRLNYKAVFMNLKKWAQKETFPFTCFTNVFLNGFRKYLLRKFTQDTSNTYFEKLCCIVKRAERKGLIYGLNWDEIPSIGFAKHIPVTLTEEEIVALQKTPCFNMEIAKSCILQFTIGQRWGDVAKLTWEQVTKEGEMYRIIIKQEKTQHILPCFITAEMFEWIGAGKERKGLIFKLPVSKTHILAHINQWCKKAGINKHIGTHTFRRSCATLLYKKGVNIVTISKILGHSNIQTTMKYIGVNEGDILQGIAPIQTIAARFNYSIVGKVA